MREFRIIDAAQTEEQLRLRLKPNELEEYGESFIPEFVYEVIRQLPRFRDMRVSSSILIERNMRGLMCTCCMNKERPSARCSRVSRLPPRRDARRVQSRRKGRPCSFLSFSEPRGGSRQRRVWRWLAGGRPQAESGRHALIWTYCFRVANHEDLRWKD